ncbi:hypothetical protein ACA910_019101 [Epithemia clementina (nom. ined.)]
MCCDTADNHKEHSRPRPSLRSLRLLLRSKLGRANSTNNTSFNSSKTIIVSLLIIVVILTIIQIQNSSFCLHKSKSHMNDQMMLAFLSADPVPTISYSEPCLVYPINASKCRVTNQYESSDRRHLFRIVPKLKQRPKQKAPRKAKTAAMCLFVKNEQLYVNEYVDYHLAIGFDEILVYDNSDDNNLREWVEQVKGPQTNNRISITHFPGRNNQEMAYLHCYHRLKERNHTWMGNLDVDERLVLQDTEKYPSVVDLFQDHLQSGSLSISWYLFGHSNQTKYLPMPLAQRFRYRNPGAHDHYKTFGHLATILKRGIGVHHTLAMPPATSHDLLGNTELDKVPMDQRNMTASRIAAVYHFWTKSVEEWVVKACWRGRPSDLVNVNCDLSYSTSLSLGSGEYDDNAWQSLKRFVPEYAVLD